MINTFQFLLNDLNIKTLIRLKHITNDSYFKIVSKERLGFDTMSLHEFLNKKNNSKFFYEDKLNICKNKNNLHIYSGDEAVHFRIKIINDNILLTTYLSELRNIVNFKKMMLLFKNLFNEFYTDNCNICHSIDMIVRLKINNSYIEIPPYINFTLVQNNEYINKVYGEST